MSVEGPQPWSPSGSFSQPSLYAAGSSTPQEPLSVADTLAVQLDFIGKGFRDALYPDPFLNAVRDDPEIQANVVKSVVLNLLCLVSVVAFNWSILPLLDPSGNGWLHRNFEAVYQGMWLSPLVAVSLFLNLQWSSLIADRAFTIRHGRRAVTATPYTGMVAHIASSAYRAILIASYLLLTFLLQYLPFIGTALSIIYICWVNSYYCFEYLWISKGMTLSQRVKHEEERWAYYLAFGLPSALVCMWGSSLTNAAIFALLFPYFVVQATHASPVPQNPSDPSGSSNRADLPPSPPNPSIPMRLHFFAPVIIVNDILVKLLSVTGASRATKRSLGLNTLASAGDGELIGGASRGPSSVLSASGYGHMGPANSDVRVAYRVRRSRE